MYWIYHTLKRLIVGWQGKAVSQSCSSSLASPPSINMDQKIMSIVFSFPLYVIFSNTLPTICSSQQIAGCSLFLPSFFTDQLSSISNEIRKSNNFFDSNHSLVKLCPTLSTSNHFEYLIQTSSHQWGWRGASPLLALLVIFFFYK